ncbi:Crp/Fnr family transcriptional regulator [Parafrankia sp. FMc2]|uniref:Crp/Fnr family transcriptional regulator n=1 Tax=Parafrankia sp. FMc2 TaxID=3233196 RepID=UPI0034D76A1A
MPNAGLQHWPPRTFLGRLTGPAAEEAVRLGWLCSFISGEYLLRDSEPTDHVLLLLDGVVKVFGVSGDRDVLIGLRVGGDVVGDLAALDGQRRAATIVAGSQVAARRMPAADWRGFLDRMLGAREAYTRLLADRLRAAVQRQVDLGGCRLPVRVARILTELGRRHGVRTETGLEIDMAITQPDLASAAGCSESALRTVLGRLRRAGVLSTEYRRLVILDPEGLRRLANGVDEPDLTETQYFL